MIIELSLIPSFAVMSFDLIKILYGFGLIFDDIGIIKTRFDCLIYLLSF